MRKKYNSSITLANLKILAQEVSDEYLDPYENLVASKILTRLMVKVFDYIEKQNKILERNKK